MSEALTWTVLALAGKVKPVTLPYKVSATMTAGKVVKPKS